MLSATFFFQMNFFYHTIGVARGGKRAMSPQNF